MVVGFTQNSPRVVFMNENLASRVRLGSFEVDLSAGELRDGNAAVLLLPDQPLQVLRMLIEADGAIVSREQIEKKLWPHDTVVEFDSGINSAVKKLRRALGDSGDEPRYIETISKRGYRLLVPVARVAIITTAPPEDEQKLVVEESVQSGKDSSRPGFRRKSPIAAVAVCIIIIVAGGVYLHSYSRPKLTERDSVVLGDFDNKTGNALFDDTLKQGLSVQLGQSPFLDLVSELKVNQILREMGDAPGERLTPGTTREVCVRANSKAMINGSIALLGSQYVIGLRAVDCNTGQLLAQEQQDVEKEEAVLRALDDAASSLRSKLGESLSSVAKYDTPLEEATTSSLEALKAYSLARKTGPKEGEAAAIPLYNRAIQIDPNFAEAYIGLAEAYSDLNRNQESAEFARKAYELRDKVSERERLDIEADYYWNYTGELEKAAEVYAQIQRLYHLSDAYGSAGYIACTLGDWDQALRLFLEESRLVADKRANNINVTAVYIALNRFGEAHELLREAEERKLQHQAVLVNRYALAFVEGDQPQMDQVVTAAIGKAGADGDLLMAQSETAGWYGKGREARILTQRAMDAARRNGAQETAAVFQAAAGLREIEWGKVEQSRADVNDALKLAPTQAIQEVSAVVLARAGDSAQAQQLTAQLSKNHSADTLVQKYWLPTIGAAIALHRKDASGAIDLLKASSAIELGQPSPYALYLLPAYLRGEAYLALGQGYAARQEFQKFIDHRGLVGNFPWGALARLGVARAYALDAATDPAEREKARAAYRNFLSLWKDADPDIPIYKQAKAEYAKLQ